MTIQVGDLFFSNRGKGPMIARVVEICGDRVKMERKESKSSKRWSKPFELSLSFLQSDKTGWKKKEERKP